MFRRYDAYGMSAFMGFMAASWALPQTIGLAAVVVALLGANLKVKPMLVGAFMGAATVGTIMAVNEVERSARFEHTEMAPSPAPFLKP
ncbi:MAG: hypothetical protein VXW91_07370 [Pseudomonadota bacterium]|nr:hypothetical protein [Pseudomonadota bacterium]MEC8665190.1 hypothetical protein [Pseudomonadota bacterium]